jgi:homoserine dehydrogenase
VADRTGVLAEIATAMRDAGVSVESFIQRGAQDGAALIAMVTHEGEARAVADAVSRLSTSPNLLGDPVVMPILDL